MSIRHMSRVWDDSPYVGKTLLVHLCLADFANDDGECWPAQVTVARKSRSTIEWVRRTMALMVEDGYLVQTSESAGRGKTARWQLLWKPPTELGVAKPETPNSDGPKPPTGKDETPNSSRLHLLDEQIEPSLEPATPPQSDAADPVRDDLVSMATAILREGWEACVPRPQQTYIAARKVIERALKSGWSEADLRAAIAEGGFPLSGSGLDIWRRRGRPVRAVAQSQGIDREGYSGEVESFPDR